MKQIFFSDWNFLFKSIFLALLKYAWQIKIVFI